MDHSHVSLFFLSRSKCAPPRIGKSYRLVCDRWQQGGRERERNEKYTAAESVPRNANGVGSYVCFPFRVSKIISSDWQKCSKRTPWLILWINFTFIFGIEETRVFFFMNKQNTNKNNMPKMFELIEFEKQNENQKCESPFIGVNAASILWAFKIGTILNWKVLSSFQFATYVVLAKVPAHFNVSTQKMFRSAKTLRDDASSFCWQHLMCCTKLFVWRKKNWIIYRSILCADNNLHFVKISPPIPCPPGNKLFA